MPVVGKLQGRARRRAPHGRARQTIIGRSAGTHEEIEAFKAERSGRRKPSDIISLIRKDALTGFGRTSAARNSELLPRASRAVGGDDIRQRPPLIGKLIIEAARSDSAALGKAHGCDCRT